MMHTFALVLSASLMIVLGIVCLLITWDCNKIGRTILSIVFALLFFWVAALLISVDLHLHGQLKELSPCGF